MAKKFKTLLFISGTFLLASCGSRLLPDSDGGSYYREAGAPNMYYENYDTNSYTGIKENDFISTDTNNISNFSLCSSTAAYTNIRNIVMNQNMLPDKNAVIVEQMLNYFRYDYRLEDGETLKAFNEVGYCPWNEDHLLASVAVKAKEINESERKNMNVVFLVDVSGSMDDDIELMKNGFNKLVNNIGAGDKVSIVTYASGVKVVLDGASGDQKSLILDKINGLTASGSTYGEAGIQQAYDIARKNYIQDANNIIILATDGDFNVGIDSSEELKKFISEKRDSGIYLSVLGFGMRNYRSDFAETLARNGNGNMFYVDSQEEINRLFSNGIASCFETIAKDVKTQIIFDKNQVKSYRLIGYENALLTEEEYKNEKTDAGEILSGDVTVAMYELILTDDADVFENMFTTEIKYKDPDSGENKVIAEQNSSLSLAESSDFVFQSMVVEYALILRNSKYAEKAKYNDIYEAYDNYADKFNEDSDKVEFLRLVHKTAQLDN